MLPAGSRESGWIRKTGAVLPVVVGSAGVEGVAGGELQGGGGFGSKVLWRYGGSRSKSSRGMGSREEEKAPGGESGEGEVLVVLEWPGRWRLQELPETGKKTSPGRLRARGSAIEVACVWEWARGSLK